MHSRFIGTVLTLSSWTPPGLDGCAGSARPVPTRPYAAQSSPDSRTAGASRVGPAASRRESTGSLRRRTGWRWAVAAAGVLVVAMVIIAALAFKVGSGSATSAGQPSPTPTPKASATPLPVTDVYRLVVPSVVLITTSKGSLGSGVIVTDTGTVLTAHHVVAGGGDISILFADGTKARRDGRVRPAEERHRHPDAEEAPRGRGAGRPRRRGRRRLGRGGHREPAGAAGQHDRPASFPDWTARPRPKWAPCPD